jgi:uncharacterized membrane-anchored protein YjiN (DUF445 family)
MNQQTENYIILKPIAERFSKVAETISDADIKYIIKEAMKEQIKGIFDFTKISEMTEEIIEKREADIKNMIFDSIINKLNNK